MGATSARVAVLPGHPSFDSAAKQVYRGASEAADKVGSPNVRIPKRLCALFDKSPLLRVCVATVDPNVDEVDRRELNLLVDRHLFVMYRLKFSFRASGSKQKRFRSQSEILDERMIKKGVYYFRYTDKEKVMDYIASAVVLRLQDGKDRFTAGEHLAVRRVIMRAMELGSMHTPPFDNGEVHAIILRAEEYAVKRRALAVARRTYT